MEENREKVSDDYIFERNKSSRRLRIRNQPQEALKCGIYLKQTKQKKLLLLQFGVMKLNFVCEIIVSVNPQLIKQKQNRSMWKAKLSTKITNI